MRLRQRAAGDQTTAPRYGYWQHGRRCLCRPLCNGLPALGKGCFGAFQLLLQAPDNFPNFGFVSVGNLPPHGKVVQQAQQLSQLGFVVLVERQCRFGFDHFGFFRLPHWWLLVAWRCATMVCRADRCRLRCETESLRSLHCAYNSNRYKKGVIAPLYGAPKEDLAEMGFL